METKRIRRQQQQQQPSPGSGSHEPENEEGASQALPERKPLWGSVRPPVVLAGFLLMLLPLIFIIYSRTPSLDWICNCRAGRVEGRAESFEATAKHGSENCSFASPNNTKANFLNENVTKNDFLQKNVTEDNDLQKNITEDNIHQKNVTKDKLLGGLLAAGFDEGSCLSRYQSVLYRKESPHKPSPYLLERLRKHEALQKRCGPNTKPYKKAIDRLKPLGKGKKRKKGYSNETTECGYLTVMPFSGLGNRIMSITSAFLYALLTNRVLLIERHSGIGDLFCEPFPDTSWLLPQDFSPRNQFRSLSKTSPQCFGNMLKNKVMGNGINGSSNESLSPYVFLNLANGYSDFDQLFFCEDDQRLLRKIPWLVVSSNQYFVPALFFIPTFEEELGRLFPERDTVFHHLGRYLFHPTNPVWGLITRSYESYLTKADERVGLQIRVFNGRTNPLEYLNRILKCALEEKLLPNISLHGPVVSTSTGAKSKVVLITSLDSTYFEKIRRMYWEHPTATGEIISVYQPSHEGAEQTGNTTHEMKAWAEIYLLSLCDTLVTSTWSTFGYVAQGLAGLKPLITMIPSNPDCRLAMSMEPCYHFPPFYGCKAANTSVDAGAVLPYVRHCEDMKNGLKLV
ncbi:probable fucosyltransferase 8 [Elaeis guineensis]|uniref:probable fucosyltransferase 8 n=1 Tax=Elaeis guineensis var. tenera TaxID=51953 RepID=UPI003C6CFC30